MTQAGPLRWRTGTGWLLLAGGGRWQDGKTGEIDAAALGWADLDRPIALIPTAGGSTADGEALLEYLAELGGPSGYVVPLFGAADAQQAEVWRSLREAGLILIPDGPDALGLVQALRGSPALDALAEAFESGATVLGLGAGAVAMGVWVAGGDDPEAAEPGWGWLPEAIIEPHFVGTASSDRLRGLLSAHQDCLGMGVPEGVALALGPDGRVETVGRGQVTVVLGEVAE